MISIDLLKEKGFKVYKDTEKKRRFPSSYLESHQLQVKDNAGTKYAINIDVWQERQASSFVKKIVFAPFADYRLPNNKSFNIELAITDDTDLEFIFTFFEKMFNRMDCTYYEANEITN